MTVVVVIVGSIIAFTGVIVGIIVTIAYMFELNFPSNEITTLIQVSVDFHPVTHPGISLDLRFTCEDKNGVAAYCPDDLITRANGINIPFKLNL